MLAISGSYLGRLADLLADGLPLVVLIFLDRIVQRGALPERCQYRYQADILTYRWPGFAYLVLGKFGIVHVLRSVSMVAHPTQPREEARSEPYTSASLRYPRCGSGMSKGAESVPARER